MNSWKETYFPSGMVPVVVMAVSGTILFNTLPLFIGYVADRHDLSDVRAGLVGSTLLLGYALATITSLFWIHRVSWRTVAMAAISCGLMSLAALNFVADFSAVLATSFLLGATSSVGQVVANAWIDKARRPSPLFGTKGTVDMSVAAVAILFLSIFFAAELSLGKLLLVYGLVYGVCLVAGIGVRGPDKTAATAIVRGCASGWAALLILAFNSIAMVGFWAFAERMGLERGLTQQQAGRLLAISLIFGVLGALCAGFLARRFHLIKGLTISYVAVIANMLLFAFGSFSMAYVVAILAFQFLWITLNILQIAFVAEMDRHSGLVAIVAIGMAAGGAVGPGLAGWLRTAIGDFGVYLFVFAATVLSLMLTWWLQKYSDSHHRVASVAQ